jgi:hypothetical protein
LISDYLDGSTMGSLGSANGDSLRNCILKNVASRVARIRLEEGARLARTSLSLIPEYGVKINHHVVAWLVHNRVAIHVPSRIPWGESWQIAFQLIRERLYPPLPPRREFSGAIVFLYESWWKLAPLVVITNLAEMFFAEARVAIPLVTVAVFIVAVFPMLPAVLIVTVSCFGTLRHQCHAHRQQKEHQSSHIFVPEQVYDRRRVRCLSCKTDGYQERGCCGAITYGRGVGVDQGRIRPL